MLRKMNKRVCGVMLAAMMAAAVSVTACGGQGSTGETVTVQRSEDFVGMPNPFTDNALRSGAMLAHEENSNVPLILYGVPGTSAVLAMPG